MTKLRLTILCGLIALGSEAALAQVQRSGGGGASPQIMQQYQQLSAERVALQSENARLKKEADDSKAQLQAVTKQRDELKGSAGRSGGELERLRTELDASTKALAKSRQSIDELVARFRETATTLKSVEAERAQLQAQFEVSDRGLDRCAVNNVGLYDLTTEVLKRWEGEGPFSRLARSEPFLRIKQTEVENLADEYRERARQLKLKRSEKEHATMNQPAPEKP